jgi:enterochelin esterase family protein
MSRLRALLLRRPRRSRTSVRPSRSASRACPREKSPTRPWKSKVFEGTIREYWVYVPAQYDGTTPAAVMVFQDGHSYVSEKGWFRVPVVFDNLIAEGEMPVTVGIFLNPGHKSETLPKPGWEQKNNRSFEYDTLSDQYAGS